MYRYIILITGSKSLAILYKSIHHLVTQWAQQHNVALEKSSKAIGSYARVRDDQSPHLRFPSKHNMYVRKVQKIDFIFDGFEFQNK